MLSAVTPVTLSGTAGDMSGINAVTWQNAATGETGPAEGTTNWSAAVPLIPGRNAITITAFDVYGNKSMDEILIVYDIPVPVISGDSPAGLCGSVGFDIMFPLALLWLCRKGRARRRREGGP